MEINQQAIDLNNTIKKDNPVIYSLLSEKGRTIFFPKLGILSQAADAKGKKINATIGIAVEDDKSPMHLNSIARKIDMNPADVFPYAPSYGNLNLREEWQKLLVKKNPDLSGKKISLPVVSHAITEGLSIIGYLFVNPDDKIIIPDMFWGNYNLIFVNGFGAELDKFRFFKEGKFDLDSLKEKLDEDSTGKKMLLLNFPNNPAGYTPTTDEVDSIVEVIKDSAEKGNEILVICDDAYFGLVYEEGIYKQSIFSKLADLHENVLAIKLDGATKEYFVWGLRVGFITYASKGITESTCKAIEEKTAGAIRGSISNASNLSENLVLTAFRSESLDSEIFDKFSILKSRYEKVKEVLKGDKYNEFFTPVPFNSGYFMCIKLKEGLDAETVRQVLLKKYDTGVISIGNLLRIAFSSVPEKDIKELFENIYEACKEV